MSRTRFWLLNALWQLAMFSVLQGIYKFGSDAFGVDVMKVSHDLWIVAGASALISSIIFYVIIEITGCFPKRVRKDQNRYVHFRV